MNNDIKNKTPEQIEKEIWQDLYEFVDSCIYWEDGSFDWDRWKEGKEIFQIKLKED